MTICKPSDIKTNADDLRAKAICHMALDDVLYRILPIQRQGLLCSQNYSQAAKNDVAFVLHTISDLRVVAEAAVKEKAQEASHLLSLCIGLGNILFFASLMPL